MPSDPSCLWEEIFFKLESAHYKSTRENKLWRRFQEPVMTEESGWSFPSWWSLLPPTLLPSNALVSISPFRLALKVKAVVKYWLHLLQVGGAHDSVRSSAQFMLLINQHWARYNLIRLCTKLQLYQSYLHLCSIMNSDLFRILHNFISWLLINELTEPTLNASQLGQQSLLLVGRCIITPFEGGPLTVRFILLFPSRLGLSSPCILPCFLSP